MAIIITDECINCGACEPECPNTAIYEVAVDKTGYSIKNTDGKNLGLLRKTSSDSYLYVTKNKVSVGYFDNEGNLIIETYDDKNDVMIVDKYLVVK